MVLDLLTCIVLHGLEMRRVLRVVRVCVFMCILCIC